MKRMGGKKRRGFVLETVALDKGNTQKEGSWKTWTGERHE